MAIMTVDLGSVIGPPGPKGDAGSLAVNTVIPAGRLRGDINGDALVDNADLELRSNGTGSAGIGYSGINFSTAFPDGDIPLDYLAADVNANGSINIYDIDKMTTLISRPEKLGVYSSDITGNWINNPDADTQSEQFYTDIAIEGMTAQCSAVVIFSASENSASNNALCPRAECMDGALRIYARFCPVEEMPCIVMYMPGNGSAFVAGGVMKIDGAPKQGSANSVSGGGVYDALLEKAEVYHTHSANDISSGILSIAGGGTGVSSMTGTDYSVNRPRGVILQSSAPVSVSNGCIVGVYE